jgi:hypothetical protein
MQFISRNSAPAQEAARTAKPVFTRISMAAGGIGHTLRGWRRHSIATLAVVAGLGSMFIGPVYAQVVCCPNHGCYQGSSTFVGQTYEWSGVELCPLTCCLFDELQYSQCESGDYAHENGSAVTIDHCE